MSVYVDHFKKQTSSPEDFFSHSILIRRTPIRPFLSSRLLLFASLPLDHQRILIRDLLLTNYKLILFSNFRTNPLNNMPTLVFLWAQLVQQNHLSIRFPFRFQPPRPYRAYYCCAKLTTASFSFYHNHQLPAPTVKLSPNQSFEQHTDNKLLETKSFTLNTQVKSQLDMMKCRKKSLPPARRLS
jgi:hypothetical protein